MPRSSKEPGIRSRLFSRSVVSVLQVASRFVVSALQVASRLVIQRRAALCPPPFLVVIAAALALFTTIETHAQSFDAPSAAVDSEREPHGEENRVGAPRPTAQKAVEKTAAEPAALTPTVPFRFQERLVQAALFSAVASGAALLSGTVLGVVHHALTAVPVPPTLSLWVPFVGAPFFTFLLSAITLFPMASPLAVWTVSVSSAFVVAGALLLLGFSSWQKGAEQGFGPNPDFALGIALFGIPPVMAGVTAFGVGFLFSPPSNDDE